MVEIEKAGTLFVLTLRVSPYFKGTAFLPRSLSENLEKYLPKVGYDYPDKIE